MEKTFRQTSINFEKPQIDATISACDNLTDAPYGKIAAYFDKLNEDRSHMQSRDDTCTPMDCVKTMLDYVPSELWLRPSVKVLDPCCGNGNFGAYCQFKTPLENIWFNETNPLRIANCKKILNPTHINNEDAFDMHGDFDSTWDLIMANPPYSGGGNKNRSLSNRFIELAISLLNDRGYLCFITPNNWMTYNNDNTTLKLLLTKGSFVVIDNSAKKFFHKIGSSFTIFVWQKGVFDNRTKIINSYLIKDVQENVSIPRDLKFLPLYISQQVLDITRKCIQPENNLFNYRCDLHNFTQKALLRDKKTNKFKYKTIHTPKITRYSCNKQDIYDKWIIIVPLSTYYKPYVMHRVNTTQSVGYFAFDTKEQAEDYMKIITSACFKVIIHLTRYGNFNNIMVLKHLKFDDIPRFDEEENREVLKLASLIKY